MPRATICGREREPTDAAHDFRRLSPLRSKRLFPPKQQRIWERAQETATTLDKGHGRRERRTLKATTALNAYPDWAGVGQVGRIESVVEQDGEVSHQTRYFITSAPREMADAGVLLRWGPGDWSIENRSHHAGRDVRERMPVASAKAVVRRSWPHCATRRLAFSGPPERRILPRPYVGTLPRSGSSSPNSASSKSEVPWSATRGAGNGGRVAV